MKYYLLTILLFSLTACLAEFEPIHAKKEGRELNQVRFESTNDRSGQVLYTALYEQLKTTKSTAEPLYILKVNDLIIEQSNISVAADGTARLNQVLVIGVFSLQTADDYSPIASFRLRAVSTYNLRTIDAYSNEVAFQGTRDHLLYDIAEQAKIRLLDILLTSEDNLKQ